MLREVHLMELILSCQEAFRDQHSKDQGSEGRLAWFVAVAQAFGLQVVADIPKPRVEMVQLARPGPQVDDDGLRFFLGECIAAYQSMVSPFSGMKEGTESMVALYQRVGPRLAAAEASKDFGAFEQALDELTMATAALLWHLPENATVEVDFLGPRIEIPDTFF
ncbi:hypothetical protein F0U44_12145 [Nocardioides humilatus]|uniref:Uncharacterized protein n=1 Tax=Nocardioides humilatus TaxID=2607660 RepID=A0A5B1LFF0_9ACTN|nr:hypothetical protein [Nocardioides humilatus]KAA1419196.1 hypothetical protein F0U44_12145 [Nocardioides humilatus]